MDQHEPSTDDPPGGIEDHDRGLVFDLPTLIGRRRALSLIGGAGVLALAACSSTDSTVTTPTSASSATAAGGPGSGPPPGGPGGSPPPGGPGGPGGAGTGVTVAEGEIPEETAGPYPADGSNGANVLTSTGIVRRDITASFGSASGRAGGVPLTIALKIVNLQGESASPYAGAAVYLWHCDRDGNYSMYSAPVSTENYLRGVQVADSAGRVTFTSIFPACYSGRWPHIHFEVYRNVATATAAGSKLRTSQLALPAATCTAVYATDGYSASVANLARVTLDSDNVFGDGHSLQLATVTGSVPAGLTVALTVPV